MAQLTSRFELAASELPLFSDWVGRTILADEQRQTNIQATPTNLPQVIQKPQLIYAENIIPAVNGYKSVAFDARSGPVPGSRTVTNIWETQDTLQRNAIIASCSDGTLWLFDEEYPRWLQLNSPAAWNGAPLTFALVSGFSFAFVPGAGLYELDGGTRLLVKQTVTGITDTLALGICGSFGYLVFYDSTTIYYSSATNPLDHVPSISTGAGSGAIQEARGAIRFIKQNSLGLMIYCEKNVVSAQYSQNIRYPWVFKSVDNSMGVGNADRVSVEDEAGNQYALSIAGMMAMNVKSARQVFPAVTEFLAAKRIETYNRTTHTSSFTAVPDGLLTRIKFIGSRWIVISYGISGYTQALVYDSALRRWGKLVIDHVAFVELFIDYGASPVRCDEIPGFASTLLIPCDAVYVGGPAQDTDSSMLACIDASGVLRIANLEFLEPADALALFGKFQLTRRKKCQVQELEVECVGAADLTATVLSAANGKSVSTITPMYKLEAAGDFVHFLSADAPEAENHIVELRGTFHVIGQQVTMSQGGRS